MSGLEILAAVLMAAQIVFTIQVINNTRYALQKYRRVREFRTKAAVIVPCRGLDDAFEENIRSFFLQDYEPYLLLFVVEDEQDPAYPVLKQLMEQCRPQSRANNVRLLTAGRASGCSQKLHNLLFAVRQADADTQVLAFADSDACVGPNWLSHLVYPLRDSQAAKNGAATGYRWFVPKTPNWATLTLSAVNAKIAQLLGNTRFNLAWGGSMAIRVDTFRRLNLEQVWASALSDDLSLSEAVAKAGLKIAFVPACMSASYESVSWKELWEFGRRQFLITRVYRPRMWLFGFFSSVFAVFGLWGGVAAAVWTLRTGRPSWILLLWPAVFAFCQWLHAFLRQRMIGRLLEKDWDRLKPAARADLALFWLFSIILLGVIAASAVGRTLIWRGIRYRLRGPMRVEILPAD
ncbi:MAG TPA: glycosyltransferase [Anaerohalosphaeraceae bacterium]|nr:glycosyltransferase [Anaerohalosphaeraceae bacterium]HPP56641.1 glycosyltransferase [Anaerohalosphaeraceae bacterium]